MRSGSPVAEVDVERNWLRSEKATGAAVTLIFCQLCRQHESSLRGLRNFSRSFVDEISGTALKKDNVVKHSKSDMHSKVVGMSVLDGLFRGRKSANQKSRTATHFGVCVAKTAMQKNDSKFIPDNCIQTQVKKLQL